MSRGCTSYIHYTHYYIKKTLEEVRESISLVFVDQFKLLLPLQQFLLQHL